MNPATECGGVAHAKKGTNAMEERMLTMRVEGEAITQIAREQCYYSRKFDSAMNILIASLQNEELEEGEIAGIALSILDGRAEIKGTYPDGDYRLEYLEVQDEKWKLGNLIDKIARELEQQKKEKQTLLKKYLFVLDSLEEWEKRSLNDEYFEEWNLQVMQAQIRAAYGYNGKEIKLSWNEIAAKAAAGDFTGLNIGDYKDITLTTGESVRMELAGIDTYFGYQSNNNHRLYFISRDCLATAYAMNSTNTNTGGFPASALKTTLNTTIFNTLPADLRAVIKADKRLCSTKGSWAWQEDQKLWLPSEVEVWGHNSWSEVGYGNGCGVQFPIFTGSLRHICKGQGKGKAEQGSRSHWWCDSPSASNTTLFCGVNYNGNAGSYDASTALAVPLCFTV